MPYTMKAEKNLEVFKISSSKMLNKMPEFLLYVKAKKNFRVFKTFSKNSSEIEAFLSYQ